jgi:hypothetical protein
MGTHTVGTPFFTAMPSAPGYVPKERFDLFDHDGVLDLVDPAGTM